MTAEVATMSALLDRVAALGLDTAATPPASPLDEARWQQLFTAVRWQRLTGILAWGVAEGRWPASVDQEQALYDAVEAEAAGALLLERQLLRVEELFRSRGIDFRVLKGAAHAHAIYPDPGLRGYGDIDVLVPSPQIEEALRALGAAGGVRLTPELRKGFDRRFGKGVTVRLPGGAEIDLHRTFVAGPFGMTIPLESLFETRDVFELAGHHLPLLAREERFMHACLHAALGNRPPRLVPLRDVAQMLGAPLDTERVLALARLWRAEVVVAHAVLVTTDRLSLQRDHPLAEWAAGYQPCATESRWLSTYAGPQRSYAAKALAGLPLVQGPSAKAAYLVAHLLPARSPNRPHRNRWRARLRAFTGSRA
jgi:hypothetical protein